MKRSVLVSLVLVWLVVGSVAGSAQDVGYWRAESKTAKGVTGDLAISPVKVTINFTSFPLAQIRTLKPEEVRALFDLESDSSGSGNLYRLSIPPATRFLHKNSLCAGEETQWMATAVTGKNLQVAFLSGPDMPQFTVDARLNSTNLCGLYLYAR